MRIDEGVLHMFNFRLLPQLGVGKFLSSSKYDRGLAPLAMDIN